MSYDTGYKMSRAEMSYSKSKGIKVGNESHMLEGKAPDSYHSKYNSKTGGYKTESRPGKPSRGDKTMSQINRMTRGTANA